MDPSKEKMLAVVSHLGGLAPICLVPLVIPFLVWVLKGDESDFVNRQSKEALNFQISLVIYELSCLLLVITVIGIPIAFFAYWIFVFTNIVCSIIGAMKTSKGQTYQYPLNLRLIK